MGVKEIFGERVKSLRLEKGLTQGEFAEIIGISRISVGHYEKADRTADIEVLSRIAEAFNVSFNYLLGKDEAKTSTQEEMMERLGLSETAIMELEHRDEATLLLINKILESEWYCYLAEKFGEFDSPLATYMMEVSDVIENAVMFEPKSEEEITLIRTAVWENLITREQSGKYMNGSQKALEQEIETELSNTLRENGYASILLTKDEYMEYKISQAKGSADGLFLELLEEKYSNIKKELAKKYYEKILKKEIEEESHKEELKDGEHHETDE